MAIAAFPPISQADEHGLLALGGDLQVPSLLLAYTQGIFPWPIDPEMPMAWFSPDPRGIVDFSKVHLSRSLIKAWKKTPFRVTFNQEFTKVIHSCAQVHSSEGAKATWITEEIIDAYIDLYEAGHAFSVETWLGKELVGGLYGVSIGHYISGESMFYLRPNASKVAIAVLAASLLPQKIMWLDTQMITPVTKAMGGEYIPRKEFKKKLNAALENTSLMSIFLQQKIKPLYPPFVQVQTQ
ncbi:MAG: leucyl/phenylalanyl-tRNA--protein transferase [Bdellovibrionales bacterium GWA2_49_15]|nr:MAG: leucyl/phenylalanyl-tRNA--protein transferase [Bdellovibrionales bacterium GWA2_49_15]HAZ14288.1 leucyl/phenylalanyl-tRNA--protein transferase [Bdellovibrionales bacterium]